jgi:FkbM family methyltransferase
LLINILQHPGAKRFARKTFQRIVGFGNSLKGGLLDQERQQRMGIATSCRDCDDLPKVPKAGQIIDFDGEKVQVMHEGTMVLAGCYYGDWQHEIIAQLNGHHEPQEERIFSFLLQYVDPGSLMVELGSFWAYYTNWYLGAVPGSEAICIEPDGNRLRIGEANLRINGRKARMIKAGAGGTFQEDVPFWRASDEQTVRVPIWDYPRLLQEAGAKKIELLHMDVQGAEYGFLESMKGCRAEELPRFLVVSTHPATHHGEQVGHAKCLEILRSLGAKILVEHSAEESFSFDGLAVAAFLEKDAGLEVPHISRRQG